MSSRVDPIYTGICPRCGGDASSSSIEHFGVCSKCVVDNSFKYTLNAYNLTRETFYEISRFQKFFAKVTNGLKPWGPQKTWIKRLINGENTALIAPTGTGKTTLLLVYSLYMATEYGKKALILAPTKSLARQIYDRLKSYAGNIESSLNILFYDSSLSKKRREEIINRIMNKEFNILIGTNHFFIKYSNILPKDSIDIVIVDDVDSLIRSSKNIVRLLKLLGYTDELIELTKKKFNIMWKIILSRTFNNDELAQKYIGELIEIEDKIKSIYNSSRYKQIIIASATGRTRGIYGRILRSILRMDLSGITIYGRDVSDTKILIDLDKETGIADKVRDIIKKLGKGGIILISPRHPFKDKLAEILSNLIESLSREGITIEEASPKSISKLINREIWAIYGSSSYYGISVRGIDAPKSIRYVIFLGTPMFTIELKSLLASPKMLIRIIIYLKEHLHDKKYIEYLNELRRNLFKLNSNELRLLSLYLRDKINLDDLNNKLSSLAERIRKICDEILRDTKKILNDKGIIELGTVTLMKNKDKYIALIPDIMTYIQASGRTSRLLLGRMTHGLSLIVESRQLSNVVKSLERKIQFFMSDFQIVDMDKIDLDHELEVIESTRREYTNELLKYKNILVIVESPTKAKTIARFFGKPARRVINSVSIYEIPFMYKGEIIHLNIMASKGHLFDLTTDPNKGYYGVIILDNAIHPVYETIKRCRVCGYEFTHGDRCPRCGSTSYRDSMEIIDVLRKLAGEADEVYIATDPDIEGEKIAYDIFLSIKSFNKNIWRIELHEITVNEFLKALENKRHINRRLVEAEIYRRVLDRLIGFSLSIHLWSKFSKNWLGAGRVQTPVLGWIIDKYRIYKKKMCRMIVFKLTNNYIVRTCIPIKDKILYKKLIGADKLLFKPINVEVKTIHPQPPLTTDELLYIVGLQGIPAKTTMKIAQELFESGLITYHRTDYHYVSNTGIKIAEKYLLEKGMSILFKPSHWGEKGAHEAIRPIYPYDRNDLEKAVAEGLVNPVIPLTWLHYKVYDIIFKRFMSSQMKPYKLRIVKANVYVDDYFIGEVEIPVEIVEEGFNRVLDVKVFEIPSIKDEFEIGILEIKSYRASAERLHTEASIVKEMKKNGIGRPSTYATIINSILRHGYVIRSKKRGYLIPTKTGIEVYDYLSSTFEELVSVETTRNMEVRIDKIINNEYNVYDAIYEVVSSMKKYNLPLSHKPYSREEASISS